MPEQTPNGWRAAPGSRDVPLIIAHRGFSSAYPENTVEAFRAALEAGADGVELDVRLTEDGQVAVMHDRRVERTTNGRGPVGAFTLAELQSLDAGSWFDPRFRGARAPSLDEVFDVLPSSWLVNVELKVRGFGAWALASRVVDVVRRHRRFDHTLVASFNALALTFVRLLEPRIVRGYIWSALHPPPLRWGWLAPLARPYWMDPDLRTFSPKLLRKLHRQGRPVLAWDVDAGTELRSLSELRLDGLVTDRPDRFVGQREALVRQASQT